jgi:hypothetical protein
LQRKDHNRVLLQLISVKVGYPKCTAHRMRDDDEIKKERRKVVSNKEGWLGSRWRVWGLFYEI